MKIQIDFVVKFQIQLHLQFRVDTVQAKSTSVDVGETAGMSGEIEAGQDSEWDEMSLLDIIPEAPEAASPNNDMVSRVWRDLSDAEKFIRSAEPDRDYAMFLPNDGDHGTRQAQPMPPPCKVYSQAPLCEQPGVVDFDPLTTDLAGPCAKDVQQFVVCKKPGGTPGFKQPQWLIQVDNSKAEWTFNAQKRELDNPKKFLQVGERDFLYHNSMCVKPIRSNQQKPSVVPNVYWVYQRAIEVSGGSAAAGTATAEGSAARKKYELVDEHLGLGLWVLKPKDKTERARKRRCPFEDVGERGGHNSLPLVCCSSQESLQPASNMSVPQMADALVELCRRDWTPSNTVAALPELDPVEREQLARIACEGLEVIVQRMRQAMEEIRQDLPPPPSGAAHNDDRWPDYIFEEDFHLPTLRSVIEYAMEHKHLPGVVSEREVEANFDMKRETRSLLRYVEMLCLWLHDEIIRREIREYQSMASSAGQHELAHAFSRISRLERMQKTCHEFLDAWTRIHSQALMSRADSAAGAPAHRFRADDVVGWLLFFLSACAYGGFWYILSQMLQGLAKTLVPFLMKFSAPLFVIRMCQKFASCEPKTAAYLGFFGAFLHFLAIPGIVSMCNFCIERCGSCLRRVVAAMASQREAQHRGDVLQDIEAPLLVRA